MVYSAWEKEEQGFQLSNTHVYMYSPVCVVGLFPLFAHVFSVLDIIWSLFPTWPPNAGHSVTYT